MYKLEYYKRFLKLALKLEKEKPVIFCGDVNATVEDIDLARPKRKCRKLGCTKRRKRSLKEWKKYFLDIWRKKSKKEMYTWWDMKTRSRERNVGWRIDYFFISKSLEKKS